MAQWRQHRRTVCSATAPTAEQSSTHSWRRRGHCRAKRQTPTSVMLEQPRRLLGHKRIKQLTCLPPADWKSLFAEFGCIQQHIDTIKEVIIIITLICSTTSTCCVCFYFVALDVSLGFHFLLCVCYVNPAYGCQIEINCIVVVVVQMKSYSQYHVE